MCIQCNSYVIPTLKNPHLSVLTEVRSSLPSRAKSTIHARPGIGQYITPFPIPTVTQGGIALSESEKTETLAENLEAQFQPVTDPSVPAVIETVDLALRSYFFSPASVPQLTTPNEVREATSGLKVSKAPGPNGIPNRALQHLTKRTVSLLARIFNAVPHTLHVPQNSKHARVISILQPGRGSALPSSFGPISLLDTTGKLFENILLARICMK